MGRNNLIPVVGLGAGGHAKVVIEVLRLTNSYNVVGLLDMSLQLRGKSLLGIPVLGDDNLLSELYEQGIRHAFIGLGATGNTQPRRRLYEKASQCGLKIVNAIHPQAIISSSATVGIGLTVMPGAIINASARLGDNVIINTGAIVEHDCVIGDHVHIASGARLASAVSVEDGVHVGLGACVRQCLRIGRNSIIGAGAVVTKDVPENVIVVGAPARVLRTV